MSNLSIYPNPSEGTVFIKGEGLNVNRLKVYSLLGNVLINRAVSNSATTTFELPEEKGIYLVEIHTSKGVTTRKVIKR
jgi:hypothetical protein